MFWGWIHARRWCKSTRINPLTSAKRASVNEGRTELSCHWPRPKARVPKPLHTSCFCNFYHGHQKRSTSLTLTAWLTLQFYSLAELSILQGHRMAFYLTIRQFFLPPSPRTLRAHKTTHFSWLRTTTKAQQPRPGGVFTGRTPCPEVVHRPNHSVQSQQEQPAHPMLSTQDECISRRLPRPQIFFCPSTIPSDKAGGTSTSPRPVGMNHLPGHNPLGST